MQELDSPMQKLELARSFRLDAIELLLKTSEGSFAVWSAPPGPKSELAAARRLLQAYDLLGSLAVLAPRGADKALLKELRPPVVPTSGAAGASAPPLPDEPWLPSRPRRVEEIPLFSPANIQAWRKTVADADARALGERRGIRNRAPQHPAPRATINYLQLIGEGRNRGPVLPATLLAFFGDHAKVITIVSRKA